MANYFVSVVNVDQLSYLDDTASNTHNGTASTAGDKIELRMDSTVTRFQAMKALDFFKRYFKQGGVAGISSGANMGNP